jgi:predicted CopG family antitoxin
MHGSRMSKTITINDDVYKLLSSLTQSPGDSFTKVLRRHVSKPLETAGEILEAYENAAPSKADPVTLNRLLKTRGRRSGGRLA